MTDLERWSNQVAKNMNSIDRRTNALEQSLTHFINAQRAALQQGNNDELLAQVDKLFEHQKQYFQIVMAVGYGAFLTLWATSADQLIPELFAAIGVLITFSLVVFVLIEIARMRMTVAAFQATSAVDEDGHGLTASQKVNVINAHANSFDKRWQPHGFWLTVVPGVAAGGLLLACYLASLVNRVF